MANPLKGNCVYCKSETDNKEFFIESYDHREDDHNHGSAFICKGKECQARFERHIETVNSGGIPSLIDSPS